MTEQEFEASLGTDGYDVITTVSKAPGYAMGQHAHPFDACALITAGCITLQVGEVVSAYQSGDIFWLSAGTSHTESAGPDGVTYRVGRRGASA